MAESQRLTYHINPYHVYVSVQSDIDQVLDAIARDEYCSVVGPRQCGKSELLRDVASRLRSDLTCKVVMINCYRLKSATEDLVFASIAREIIEQLEEPVIERRLRREIPDTSLSFRRFAQAVANELGQRLILFVDHLSVIPRHHARGLLSSLRAAYMERSQHDPPLVVVVASSFNLAELTVGRTSPFHNIAHHVIVDDLCEADTRFIIYALLQKQDVSISEVGMERLIGAVGGDRALILRITEECAQLVAGHRRPSVTAKIVERAIEHFLSQYIRDFRPFKEMAELIEQDWEILQNIRDILAKGVVPHRALRLPLGGGVDPTFLTGAVRQVPGDEPAYAIKNEICRRFLSDYFDPARASDIYARGGRRQESIDILVQAVKDDHERYHEPLADAVIGAVYAAGSVKQASRFLAESMSHLFDVQQVQVFVRDIEAADLVLEAEVGMPSHQVQRTPLLDREALEVMGFYDDGESVRMSLGGDTVLSIPLKWGDQQTDGPLGVVLIHQFVDQSDFAERRLDVYRIRRFMREAARAMENVHTRCRQAAMLNRRSSVLDLLQRISAQIQLIVDLDISLNYILTGVTSHYGLSFNRAMLYLLDKPVHDPDARLIGRMGVGQLEKIEAETVWERIANMTFEEYVRQVKMHGIENTVVNEWVRSQSIPLDRHGNDVFSIAVLKSEAKIVQNPAQDLPFTFYETFRSTTLAVVPLKVPGRVIGLLAADKEFTRAPVEANDLFLLQAYADQAAAVVESERMHRSESYIEKLTRLHQTMRAITADLDREQVMRRITDQVVELIGAISAAFYQLEGGDFRLVYRTPTGLVEEIEPFPLEMERAFVEHLLMERKIQMLSDSGRAFVHCPLVIGDNRDLGLLCIECVASQWFSDQDRRILDLFVDQAAIALQNADHVAELTQMQNELASKEAVEKLSLFGAKWHHDLRQKTFAMLGNVDMLADDLSNNQEAQEMLEEIRQMIADIRRIPVPLDRESAPPRKRPLMLDPLLGREIKQHCKRYPEIDLDLDLQCEDAQVNIDEERFSMAIETLVQNAARAMDYTGGRFTVRSYLASGYAQVIIQDSGHGIPEERRSDFLMRPIHRESHESGTGMGVLIARQALQSFGAELKLVDTGPQGTTLSIILPMMDSRRGKQ